MLCSNQCLEEFLNDPTKQKMHQYTENFDNSTYNGYNGKLFR